jgi:hypothetical protein
MMFSTLSTLVLLFFLMFIGLILFVWSLISFGAGPRAVALRMGKPNAKRAVLLERSNPFIKKSENFLPSELVPEHISRGQIRTVKRPLSDATLSEIKAISEDKVSEFTKPTTYEQMVKRAKNPTPIPAPKPFATVLPPTAAKDPRLTQTQASNDQTRGAYVRRTLVTDPTQPEINRNVADSHKADVNPAINKVNPSMTNPGTLLVDVNPSPSKGDLKGLPPLPPAPVRPSVTHSAKDTPITKIPISSQPAKPTSSPEKSSQEKPIEDKTEAQPTLFSSPEVPPVKTPTRLEPARVSSLIPKPVRVNTQAIDVSNISNPILPKPVSELPRIPAKVGSPLPALGIQEGENTNRGNSQRPEAGLSQPLSQPETKKPEDAFDKFSKGKSADDTIF